MDVIILVFINMFFYKATVNAGGYLEFQFNLFESYNRTLMDGSCCEQREVPMVDYHIYKKRPITPPCKRQCNFQIEFCVKDLDVERQPTANDFKLDFFGLRFCNIMHYWSKGIGYGDLIIFNVTSDVKMTPLMKKIRKLYHNVTRNKTDIVRKRFESSRFKSQSSKIFKFFSQVTHYDLEYHHKQVPIIPGEFWPDLIVDGAWQNVEFQSTVGRAFFHYRFVCDPGLTGPNCNRPISCNETSLIKNGVCVGNQLQCHKDYTGRYCHQPICRHGCHYGGGNCVSPGYCKCTGRWTGFRCTQCEKDSNCVAEHTVCHPGRICQCKYGWTGAYCHMDAFICMGKTNKCVHGKCVFNFPNVYGGPNIPRCECDPGYAGDFCDRYQNLCENPHLNMCFNGGTCVYTFEANYKCVCPPNFTGARCDIHIARCSSSPCVNAYNCTDLATDYKCHCKEGWKGKHCDEDINDCYGQCAHNAVCTQGTNYYTCACPDGWEGKHCDIKINYCLHASCQNEGICVNNNISGYHCVCQSKFTGTHCEKTICAESADLSICSDNIDNCHHANCSGKGACIDEVDSYKCVCDPGYTGTHCETRIDFCSSNPCESGTCVNGLYSYSCDCEPGFHGYNCQTDIDECDYAKCLHGAKCFNLKNDYGCQCSIWGVYSGKNCEIGPDWCYDEPCQNDGKCLSSMRNFTCLCPAGYTGRYCEVKDDNNCRSMPCGPRGTCTSTEDGFECKCKYGYRGRFCHLRDYCASLPCYNGAECVHDGDNDFYCLCKKGFYGKTCDSVEDSCYRAISPADKPGSTTLVPSHLCNFNNSMCVSLSREEYMCKCKEGWLGDYCQLEKDYCVQHSCENQASCVNVDKGYACLCASGYTGKYCKNKINRCENVTCLNKGVCKPITNDFICLNCKEGWKGKLCNSESSACDGEPCLNGGTCVPDGENSFKCLCPMQYEGPTCALLSHTCKPNICRYGGTCITTKNSFMTCLCRTGYTGNFCEIDVNDCSSNPCLNGGECIDRPAWYECQCKKGFFGINCMYEENECLSNPCKNGGECMDEIGDYTCSCDEGFTGKDCSENISYEKCFLGNGDIYEHNEDWTVECNKCTCINGYVDCSNITCGPFNCFDRRNETCDCVEVDVECITPPCRRWGECFPLAKSVIDKNCSVSTAVSSYCAHLNIHFNKDSLPQGVTLREICNSFRNVHQLKHLKVTDNIELDCAYEETNATRQQILVAVYNSNSEASKVAQILARAPDDGGYDKASVLFHLKRATAHSEIVRSPVFHKLKVIKDPYTKWYIIAAFIGLVILAIFITSFIIRKRRNDTTVPVERRQNDLHGDHSQSKMFGWTSKSRKNKLDNVLPEHLSEKKLTSIPEWEDVVPSVCMSSERNIPAAHKGFVVERTLTFSSSGSSSGSSNISDLVKRLPKPGTSPPKHSPVF